MIESDIKTWERIEYAGTRWYVFSEIVDTDFGGERRIVVWSPTTRRIIGEAQECMTKRAMLIDIVEATHERA